MLAVFLNRSGIAWPDPVQRITIQRVAEGRPFAAVPTASDYHDSSIGEHCMLQNLTVTAVVVVVLWIVIIGLYLRISRRQPDVAAQMKALEEKLDRAESEVEQK